ncbi:hypothetical protein TrLO_g15212 [Triparma laevis f. longispina]|uniref:WW domain-containing protein n=1 Tax=Triparma laevis f. longispina TaxID=1714387 RepID=A0A9W7AUW8_9STRA|nr:hypothetical protein TrLO_g15212 [Triparma laevis f. longispina]
MYKCFPDPERDFKSFVTSDPFVSCEPSLERTIVNIHAGALSLVVGLGFPLLSFLKIRSLRMAGKLVFDSGMVNLFQFYNTRMPYFETVQFARKGLLIFVLTWFVDDPMIQAISSLGINGSFLLLLSCTRPFVYYPTSNSRRNLFQIAELSSTITCIIGNVLALVASFTASDQSFIDLLGGVMATVNILYFILFMYRYSRELEKTLDREAEWTAGVKTGSKLGAELNDAIVEWNLLVMSLEDNEDTEERRHFIDEMPFVKSRIVAAMRIELMETEEKRIMNVTHQISETFNTAIFRQKCRSFQRVLDPLNEDFEKFVGEARGPFNVLEIAREQKLEFVSGVLERGDSSIVEEGEGDNPLQQIEMITVVVPEKVKKNHGKAHIARAESFKQEYKARTKLQPKSKSKSTKRANPRESTLVVAPAPPQQNILGVSMSAPPPSPLPPPTPSPKLHPTTKAGPFAPTPPPPRPPAPLTPTPPPPPPKPDPWISVTDAAGKIYYVHRKTNEAVWSKP